MRWLSNCYDFRFKWTATSAIGIHPTKAWLSLLVNFKNAIWHLRRTICNKCVLNLEKLPQKRMECSRLLFDHLAWIKHQFRSGIRDSRKAGSLWELMRGVGGVSKSIHQSWWVTGLGLGLLCWGFKGVQEEIPSEYTSPLQIESVAFPPGQSTSPQLHTCLRLFDQDVHLDSSSASLQRLWRRSLTRSHKRTSMGAFKKLLERYNKCIAAGGYFFEGDLSFMYVLLIKVPIQKKSGNLSYAPRI